MEARRTNCCFPQTERMQNTVPFIAIVDDDEPIRRAMTRLCRAYQLEVITFASAEQLLDSLHANGRQPDCLVLDIHMQGIVGHETLPELSQRGANMSSIMMTCEADQETPEPPLSTVCCAYL